jgi:hypothetical protein
MKSLYRFYAIFMQCLFWLYAQYMQKSSIIYAFLPCLCTLSCFMQCFMQFLCSFWLEDYVRFKPLLCTFHGDSMQILWKHCKGPKLYTRLQKVLFMHFFAILFRFLQIMHLENHSQSMHLVFCWLHSNFEKWSSVATAGISSET